MKNCFFSILILSVIALSTASFADSLNTVNYKNLFTELLGKSENQVREKLDSAWQQLFYGNSDQRIYYPVNSDMAYIKDIGNNDIRSEGMSYGMMISVQMNKKDEFDRLWKWAKTYMYQNGGVYKGYFAWHCTPEGNKIEPNPASDGEEWIVMSLFFAAGRWGNGEGIFNYKKEAQAILDTMLHKADSGKNGATDMFDPEHKMVVFVPTEGQQSQITDPSYHLPHFYELWALWADKDNGFWKDAVLASREFFKKAADPKTGLMPDFAEFTGTPVDMWNGGHNNFRYDAWRIGMNVAIDYVWFGADKWEALQSDRLLNFFYKQGVYAYVDQYKITGEKLGNDGSLGLSAMNAVACMAASIKERTEFVQVLWESELPTGRWRYYNSMLYMLALLNVSGNFRIYSPDQSK